MRKHSRMTRLASLLLALYMAFGTATPAFADLFAFVTSEDAETGEKPAASGELNGGDGTYAVTVEYGEDAGLPEDVSLATREITPSDPEYETYYTLALEAAEAKEEEVLFARFFDIAIEGEDGKVQPESAVGVKIAVDELAELPEDAEISVFHFPDNNSENENAEDELLEEPLSLRKAPLKAMSAPMTVDRVEIVESNDTAAISEPEAVDAEVSEDGAVVFEADGFSVYGIVGTETISTTFLCADGSTYEVTVTYDQSAGIPEGAELKVVEITEENANYSAYVDQTAALIHIDTDTLSYIKLLDIAILDGDGKKITIAAPVEVQIRLLDNDNMDEDIQVVHFAEDEETETVEPELLDNTAESDTVSFQTSGFSAYAIVQGPAAIPIGWERITTMAELSDAASNGLYIGTTGNRYLQNRTTAHQSVAGLSGIQLSASSQNTPTGDAALYYFEAVEGTTKQFYIYCYDAENHKLYATYDKEASAVPYSIILTSDETQKEACTLSVSGSGAAAYWRIRFNNSNNHRWYLRNNIVDAQNADTNYYIWKQYVGGDTYGLDGKTYGLMYWTEGIMGKALMASENETSGHLDALPLTVMSKPNNGAKLYVPDESDISFWTFHFIEDSSDINSYYYYLTTVQNGSTKYLRIAADGLTLVSTPDDNCKIKVVPGSGNNAGKVYLKVGNSTLAYSGDVDEGFKVGGTAGTEWLNLVEESELTNDYFMTYSASKVSVSDESITNGSRVIVYTRVWNDTTKKYEFYAIDQDGSLVRCYESGDSIEWVGGRLNSMLWNFVEYYWEGTNDPNYYYELFNQYSYTFIAPQKSNNQILSDSTIGINLNGRRNGMYYTPIVAWDDGYYAYAGLKADLTTGKVVSCPLSETDDFYFAIVQDIPVDDELTTVPTVDHTQYGITMKMVNFGTDIYTGNDINSVQSKMSEFLGGQNSTWGYNAESGILQTQLGLDGYPVAKTGNSLSEWFSNAQEANHLFIQSTYSGTGYFEYDSVQNFAHLDSSTNNFVVYKQLGSDNTGGATHTHGLFWPYNDITAGVFSSNKNTTTISGGGLPNTDPRKYETMYLAQKSNTNYAPDYYFGMELTASFTQTPNGLDDWGHDIIYEFTGDDDFWLFVDGELILDLGGIHSAIPGSVNYRTGVVNVNGTITSLRALFEANYRGRNEGVSDEEVETYLNGIFDGEIFKPYTTHTMKIYYMERGAGSSNLHMRFNLASIKPGTVQLTKKLTGVETSETVLAEFPYQILYRTKNSSGETEEHHLTNFVADTGSNYMYNRVFYKGTTTACTFKQEYTVGGKTYEDVFILKPDETVDIDFTGLEFPEGTEFLDYKIIECGVNTDVYTEVKVNDALVNGTAVMDDYGNAVDNRKDFGIDYATTEERARVVYDNAVSPDAITNLTIQKRLYDVTGVTEITEENDNSTFDFRLYLATESGDVDSSPANMHTYHVKDTWGNYCRWDVQQQRLVSLGVEKNNWSALTPDEQASATFHTSMNGSISRIPVGYIIEVRDLIVGTKFKVVERPWEIPDGYSFLKYVYSDRDYLEAITGVTDVINTNVAPHVEVRNVKGFGLRVNKIWTDADFMSERDPVYFGIFYKDGSGAWQLVNNSLRQMAYGTTTQYWYYDTLPVPGITGFSEYVIYEVTLTNPVVDSEGKVTGYGTLTRLDNNGSLTLNGKQIGDTTASPFTYTVTYERGETSSNSNVRVDEVTNSRPGIVLKKTDWSGTALPGATFTLVDADGNNIGTYTSGSDGLITEVYLRNNVNYTLTETSAPQRYHGLEEPMVIRLDGTTVTIKKSDGSAYDSDWYTIEQYDGKTNITVKNRTYEFKVVKMDKGTNEPLPGVKFSLYREIIVDSVHSWDPNPYPGFDTITSGTDGVLPGLDNTLPAGTYQLREKSTLPGYQTLSGYITFTVSKTGVISAYGNQPDEASFAGPVIQENGAILYQIGITNAKLFKVSVWKTDTGYTTIPTGASFALYKYNDNAGSVEEGASPILTGSTGTNGILALGNLIVGKYRLVETQAPDGYNLATSAIIIMVTNNGVTAMQSSSPALISTKDGTNNTDQAHWVTGQEDNTWQIRVWNNPGVELPMTGGSGTLPYTLGGLALICGAALMYGLRMRRRERKLND